LTERATLVEGEDFYREGEFVVFTARYHLRRGYCCESGCRHCPYRAAEGVRDEEKKVEEVVE
jgi:2-iminoacetate synthase ThiH